MPKLLDALFGFRNVRGHTFYAKVLDSRSVVVDLGANQGAFSRCLANRYGCRAVAVEASPALFEQIETTPLLRKYNYAVADQDRVATFYESDNIEAGNILGPKSNSSSVQVQVQARSFRSLVSELGLGQIDLLKVDIEGAEIQMFDALHAQDLSEVIQLTVEFHDSVRIPNVSSEDVRRVCQKILSLGFDGLPMARDNDDWLFLSRTKLRLPPLARRYLSFRKSRRSN